MNNINQKTTKKLRSGNQRGGVRWERKKKKIITKGKREEGRKRNS